MTNVQKSTLREAAQQALEYLDAPSEKLWPAGTQHRIITALKAALAEPGYPLGKATTDVGVPVYVVKKAEPVQEPVAWRYKPMIGSPWSLSDDGYYISCKRDKGYIVEPLYTAPPQRKPLTEEEIRDLWSWAMTAEAERTATTQQHAFARAIERAHGIGGQDD